MTKLLIPYINKRKNYKFFKNRDLLNHIITEIVNRNNCSWEDKKRIITTKIKKFFYKNKANVLLIGLSGGVDSSLVTTLAVEAVGEKNVFAVNLPFFKDEKGTLLANILASSLKLSNFLVISINEIVQRKIEAINYIGNPLLKIETEKDLQNLKDKIRIGNLASRTRISILYDLSKALHGLVLGTGGKVEFMLGYLAKYGTPFSYDYGILNNLYKAEIYILAKNLNIPEEIINAEPTTGYYIGQTHEDELGATLEELDAISYLLFEIKENPAEIIEKYKVEENFVKKIIEIHNKTKHKRQLFNSYIKIGKCSKQK